MTMTTLPPEVLLRIFSHLSYRDLVSARRTCRQWRDLSQNEGLLRTIKERDFREDMWRERSLWSSDDEDEFEEEETYCPSGDDIGLAVFLGRNKLID